MVSQHSDQSNNNLPTPDAGIDSAANQHLQSEDLDRNDSVPDQENLDQPVPDLDAERAELSHPVDQQLSSLSRSIG